MVLAFALPKVSAFCVCPSPMTEGENSTFSNIAISCTAHSDKLERKVVSAVVVLFWGGLRRERKGENVCTISMHPYKYMGGYDPKEGKNPRKVHYFLSVYHNMKCRHSKMIVRLQSFIRKSDWGRKFSHAYA